MEIKRNEATLNRPDGDRVLDAPYVFMDLNDFTKQLKDEEAWDKNDRNGITIFKTDGLTTVLTCLHKDAGIKDNMVDGLFQVQVLSGKIRVSTDDGDMDMKERDNSGPCHDPNQDQQMPSPERVNQRHQSFLVQSIGCVR